MNAPASRATYLTWLDVERAFKRATANFTAMPAGITSIQCFADGAEIEMIGDEAGVKAWLSEIFGRVFSPEDLRITIKIGNAPYPVALIPQSVRYDRVRTEYPLWRDQVYLDTKAAKFPNSWSDGPPIVTFHSFKGGVGRTTALVTFAAARLGVPSDGPIRLLVIDADLEAPGISFWLDPSNSPTVSFVHLIEALHYAPSDVDAALNYFADELRKSSITAGGANREIFVLPATLRLDEIMDMPVLPEHIARNPENPWLLSEHLRTLGQRLQVDMILVDLRAGLTELASPLLFDPRIEHFFVTTVAPQSVVGMAEVLRRVYSFQKSLPDNQRSAAKPSLILSLLTPQLKRLSDYTTAIQMINEAYPSEVDDPISLGLEIVEADFEPAFMSFSTLRQALDALRKSSLYENASQWATARVTTLTAETIGLESGSLDASGQAAALYSVCDRFQFAERTAAEDMLVTEPLRNLAKHYSHELPNAVSVGAKGAGKTFTYLQLCRTKKWGAFLKEVARDKQPSTQNGVIYPLLWSSNIDGRSRELVRDSRAEALAWLLGATGQQPDDYHLGKAIKAAMLDPKTDWDAFWAGALTKEIPVGVSTLSDLNKWLQANDRSLVFAIDGIEDLFQNPESDESEKRAVKALLQLPNQLNDLDDRRIGLVCFVRADYVQTSIRQNVSQYLARFQPFRLEWTAEAFLRLAYWICGKAGIVGADTSKADQLTTTKLLGELEKLWGKKMGRDDAKEALTARWVFAALCDLNGRLQARDLVRFLKFAAKRMEATRSDAWKDRVLFPEAIRKSLPDCSDEKVKEAISEVAALKRWKSDLDNLNAELKRTPFSIEALKMPSDLVNSLRELGVIYEDIDQKEEPERFYLPEIYRSGLGFRSAVGGRPRIQALMKRNLGGMPF